MKSMQSESAPKSDSTQHEDPPSPSKAAAGLVGGFGGEFVLSALVAGFGALCNYLIEPFPIGFFAIIAVMAALTSLCVMFTLTGPTLTLDERIGKAIVPAFMAFIGLSTLIFGGMPVVRAVGESYFNFDFASDGIANRFGMLFLIFYPAVTLSMLMISGSQLAKYND